MKAKHILLSLVCLMCTFSQLAAGPREKTLINNGWTFSFRDASDLSPDVTPGVPSPVDVVFDDSSWQKISLPHDWAVDLPYSEDGLPSNGFKTVGYKYPAASSAWYRRHITIPAADAGCRFSLEFDGISEHADIYCNGFFLGHQSRFESASYDVTEYLDYGGDNVIAVKAVASSADGHSGAGIVRNVYLQRTSQTSIRPDGVSVKEYRVSQDASYCVIVSEIDLDNVSGEKDATITQTLLDAEGRQLATVFGKEGESISIEFRNPVLWSAGDSYLYTLRTCLYKDSLGYENLLDQYDLKIGIRSVRNDSQKGLLLNGEPVELKVCDVHSEHAGTGTAVPDALWRYRLAQLVKSGFNALRILDGPASPSLLDICDEEGVMVIEGISDMGVSAEQSAALRSLVRRDMNHPSVVVWSIGDSDEALENDPRGEAVAKRMTAMYHSLDASRPVTYSSASLNKLTESVDIPSLNRKIGDLLSDDILGMGVINCWPGPACRGDDAFLAQARFSSHPAVHIVPDPSSLRSGYMDVKVYSNCDEVQLSMNGMPLGKRAVPRNGVLDWQVKYKSGKLEAKAFRNGKKLASETVESSGSPARLSAVLSKDTLAPDGQDVAVLDITVIDAKGRPVNGAAVPLNVRVSDNISILGWGNGDPDFKLMERPVAGSRPPFVIQTFDGKCQLLVRSVENASGTAYVSIDGLELKTITLNY